MESNKIFNLLDKAIEILDRCWKGYKPVAGVKPYEAGSCEKEMATQSDMSEIEEVISMLDKAINFYDPSQARDESGKWSGSGGGSSGKTAEDGYVAGFKNMVKIAEEDAKGYKKDKKMRKIAGGLAPLIDSKKIPILEKYGISIEKQGKDYRWTENNIKAVKDYISSKEKGLGINFYDPSQERDSSGKWSGSGGMSPDKGSPSGRSSV